MLDQVIPVMIYKYDRDNQPFPFPFNFTPERDN